MATLKKAIVKKAPQPEKKKVIKLAGDDELRDLFVDGMTAMMFGPTIAKITFHSTIDSDGNEDRARAALRLVMSTETLIKMVSDLTATLQKNKKNLLEGATSPRQKTIDLLNKL